MNRCQTCKNELVADARFCNICGAPQNPENAQSDLAIPPENPQPETRAPVADAQTQNKHPLSDLPTQHIKSDSKQGRQQTPSKQTPPAHDLDTLPTSHLPSTNGQNGLGHEQTLPLLNPESFLATSKAVEHWRNNWRDRQHAEAGPAEDV